MDAYVGSICAFGFNFAPANYYLPCDGRTVNISDYQALYALIGTTFGGDGVQTFGLPNLLGRVPVGTGQGAGLSNYVLGQSGGNEAVTITASNMTPHSHANTGGQIPVSNQIGGSPDPTGAYLAQTSDTTNLPDVYATTSNTIMASTSQPSSTAGSGGLPKSIVNPLVAINYCICVNGIYPVHP